MSKEETPPAVPEIPQEDKAQVSAAKSGRKAVPWRLILIGAALSVFLLSAMILTAQARARHVAARELLARSVAAALVADLLEQRPARLRLQLERIAKAGGFRRITVAAPDGRVIASTQTATALDRPSMETRVSRDREDEVIRTPIYLAEGNPLGLLEIRMDPR
ncbi:MAG: hypothetical protein MH204_09525 [Fimbriimonadaceae bacterium]|nr:hypothetical protein [Fimbriimonadaceae bacterium]